MAATVIDTLPGGLLDFLIDVGSSAANGSGVLTKTAGDALRVGAWQRAFDLLSAEGSPASQEPWRHVADHARSLWLPTGEAVPYVDPVDPRPLVAPRPDVSDDLLAWALLELLAGLRDIRSLLPPQVTPEISPAQSIRELGGRTVEAARQRMTEQWPGVVPHLDLLDADLATRAGQDSQAHGHWQRAHQGFAALDDKAGLASAAVIGGDWLAAPSASPAGWGYALVPSLSQGSGLSESVEAMECPTPRDVAGATAAYELAAALYREVGHPRGLATVTWRLAYLAHATGDFERAATLAAAAATGLGAAGDPGSAQCALAGAVLSSLSLGRMPVVAQAVEAALGARTAVGYAQVMAVGLMYARAGVRLSTVERRPEKAMVASEIAEGIARGLGRRIMTSQTIVDQADVLRSIGARSAAAIRLSRAVESEGQPNPEPANPMDVAVQRQFMIAADLYNLANAAMDTERLASARARLNALADTLRQRSAAGDEQTQMASSMLLNFAASLDQPIVDQLYLGQSAREAGDTEATERAFARAEQLLAETPELERGMMPALLSAYRMDFDGARAQYTEWLARELAVLEEAKSTGQADSAPAQALHRQAERSLRTQAVTMFLRVKDAASARAQFTRLNELNSPWWQEVSTEIEACENEGALLELEGDLTGSLQVLTAGVTAAERVRAQLRRDDLKQAFSSDPTVQRVYRRAARVALRTGDTRALALLEQARSRALTDLISVSSSPGPSAAANRRWPDRASVTTVGDLVDRADGRPGSLARDLVLSWRAAVAERALNEDRVQALTGQDSPSAQALAEAQEALARANQTLSDRESALRAHDPNYWQFVAGGADVAPEEVTQAMAAAVDEALEQLTEGELVLVYSQDSPHLLACAVDRSGVLASFWSDEERRIGPLARALVSACASGAEWRASSQALADIVLGPFGAQLERAETVHVVASGELLRVPFGALLWNGAPLAQQRMLSVLPNLASLRLLNQSTTTNGAGRALSVGNPANMTRVTDVGEIQRAAALPAAEAEARAVAQALGGLTLLGAEATEDAVRKALRDAPVVHFATHGVLSTESPLASALSLADGQELTIAELMGLRLSADLVILSACHTGTGQPAGGDELLGLGRGILAAGARSVIVTLWPVDDESAAYVVTRFAQEYAAGKPSVAALSNSVRWLAGLTDHEVQQLRDRDGWGSALDDGGPRRRDWSGDSGVAVADWGSAESSVESADHPFAHPRHWAAFGLVGVTTTWAGGPR